MNLTEKIQRYYEIYTILMPKFVVALAFKVTISTAIELKI